MGYKITVTDRANEHLDNIIYYILITLKNKQAAASILDDVEKAYQTLGNMAEGKPSGVFCIKYIFAANKYIDIIPVNRYNIDIRRRSPMMINELMESKNLTKYRLAKNSGIPYTTINDICSGKARIEKCSAETIYRISKELGVSMESIIEPCLETRIDFEMFKSNTCHKLKEKGDIEFIIELLEEDPIGKYYRKKWYPECLYLLSMLDYISRINEIPLCTQYDDLRKMKLKEIIYPSSVLIASHVAKDGCLMQQSIAEAIPEFMQHNIVESEVRNVI